MSEGPEAVVEVHVDAPPAAVWAVASDITVPPRFSEELQEARWLDDRSFRGRNHHPAIGEWETTSYVVASEPERRFAWAVGSVEQPAASWSFELVPCPGGGTTLRQRCHLGPGPSGLTPALEAMPDKEERIIARRLDEHRANMQRTLEGIKALAEGRA
jgi:hypothetical protein